VGRSSGARARLPGRAICGRVQFHDRGEIWRTPDGLQWERAPDEGLGRGAKSVVFPSIVFQDKLYGVRIIAGTLNDIRGLDVYRTGDGATWEKVVSEGFGVGPERNATGFLSELKGDIFLCASTYDPRVLWPNRPTERRAPHGFQLWRSSDGLQWKQVGEDGFAADSTCAVSALDVIGDSAGGMLQPDPHFRLSMGTCRPDAPTVLQRLLSPSARDCLASALQQPFCNPTVRHKPATADTAEDDSTCARDGRPAVPEQAAKALIERMKSDAAFHDEVMAVAESTAPRVHQRRRLRGHGASDRATRRGLRRVAGAPPRSHPVGGPGSVSPAVTAGRAQTAWQARPADTTAVRTAPGRP